MLQLQDVLCHCLHHASTSHVRLRCVSAGSFSLCRDLCYDFALTYKLKSVNHSVAGQS